MMTWISRNQMKSAMLAQGAPAANERSLYWVAPQAHIDTLNPHHIDTLMPAGTRLASDGKNDKIP